jgi:hypothetical protein
VLYISFLANERGNGAVQEAKRDVDEHRFCRRKRAQHAFDNDVEHQQRYQFWLVNIFLNTVVTVMHILAKYRFFA